MSVDDQLRADASGVSGVPAAVGPKAATDDAALQVKVSDEEAADSTTARTKAVCGTPSKGETLRAQDAAASTRKPQRGTRRKKTGKIDNKPLKTVSAEELSRVGGSDRACARKKESKKEKSQRVGAASAARDTPHANKGQGSGSDTTHKTVATRTFFGRLAGLRKGKSSVGQGSLQTPPSDASLTSAPAQENSSAHAATKPGRLSLLLHRRSDSGGGHTKGRRAERESTPAPTMSVGERCVAAKDWLLHHPRLCATVVMLLVAAVALYSPVRNYYVARRTGQVLQVKYDQLSDENASLTHDVNRLQTKQGIEDEARKRGYVSTDEIGKDPDHPDSPSIVEAQSATTQKDPSAPRVYPDDRPWHIKALDRLFFYDPEVTWNG